MGGGERPVSRNDAYAVKEKKKYVVFIMNFLVGVAGADRYIIINSGARVHCTMCTT